MPRAFTLIELLIAIAVIALLIGILLPALGTARLAGRTTACGARLQQLGVATTAYLGDFKECLPQRLGPVAPGVSSIIGALFGGKKGQLPFYGISTIGAEGRPLNQYINPGAVPPDAEPGVCELPFYKSPLDKGAASTGLPIPGLDNTESMYDFVGASYTLNDHTLDGEDHPTLVPPGGGKMPPVMNTSRTWMIGSHTIYNFQQGGDRGMRWYHKNNVEANLLFVDAHARMRVAVPPPAGSEPANSTADYTFLP